MAINRRAFCLSTFSTLMSCGSSVSTGREVGKGCRSLSPGDLVDAWCASSGLQLSSGDPLVDKICAEITALLKPRFAVDPGVCFYQEPTLGRPNAEASEVNCIGSPDGTIFLGRRLLKLELGRWHVMGERLAGDGPFIQHPPLLIIAAHEFAHILQFKASSLPVRKKPTDEWQMEPHADFLAGWAIGQNPRASRQSKYALAELSSAMDTMFAQGDTEFGNPKHHGTHRFRMAMVEAGFDARNLDLNTAFDYGWGVANLPEDLFNDFTTGSAADLLVRHVNMPRVMLEEYQRRSAIERK